MSIQFIKNELSKGVVTNELSDSYLKPGNYNNNIISVHIH